MLIMMYHTVLENFHALDFIGESINPNIWCNLCINIVVEQDTRGKQLLYIYLYMSKYILFSPYTFTIVDTCTLRVMYWMCGGAMRAQMWLYAVVSALCVLWAGE